MGGGNRPEDRGGKISPRASLLQALPVAGFCLAMSLVLMGSNSPPVSYAK